MHAVLAVLSGLAAIAHAYTQPTTMLTDGGNAIFTPSLGQAVPVGQPFSVTWNPTTKGSVTILLLRGPSENVKPLYSIAENIPNSGSFSWTPKADLEPDTLRYGLQLIDDATGQFQYSVQFGIANSGFTSGTPTPGSSAPATSGSATPPVSTPPASTPAPASSTPAHSNSTLSISSRAPTSASTTASRAPTSSKPASTASATPSGSFATAHRVGGALGLVGGVLALFAL